MLDHDQPCHPFVALQEQNAMLQQGFDANARQMQREIDELRREMSQAQSRGGGGGVLSLNERLYKVNRLN